MHRKKIVYIELFVTEQDSLLHLEAAYDWIHTVELAPVRRLYTR